MAHLVSTPRCCVLDLHRENLTRKRPDFSRLLFFVQIVQIRFVLNLVFFFNTIAYPGGVGVTRLPRPSCFEVPAHRDRYTKISARSTDCSGDKRGSIHRLIASSVFLSFHRGRSTEDMLGCSPSLSLRNTEPALRPQPP